MRVRADAHVRVDAGSEDWKAHAGYMNAREKFQGLVSSGSLIFGEIPAAGKEGAHPTGGRRACPRPPQRHRRVSVQNPFRSGTARPLQCASRVMGTGGGSAFPPCERGERTRRATASRGDQGRVVARVAAAVWRAESPLEPQSPEDRPVHFSGMIFSLKQLRALSLFGLCQECGPSRR